MTSATPADAALQRLGDDYWEVDRYIAMPGQAVSYKVGQLEIQRLRAGAEATARTAGTPFDIKTFHDTVLGSGTVSLPVLRTIVTS